MITSKFFESFFPLSSYSLSFLLSPPCYLVCLSLFIVFSLSLSLFLLQNKGFTPKWMWERAWGKANFPESFFVKSEKHIHMETKKKKNRYEKLKVSECDKVNDHKFPSLPPFLPRDHTLFSFLPRLKSSSVSVKISNISLSPIPPTLSTSESIFRKRWWYSSTWRTRRRRRLRYLTTRRIIQKKKKKRI